MQKKKQGISLIVLVITIIVMIILAAAIIISLQNNGIINRASTAVKAYNEYEVNQIAQLAWSEAYLDGARTVQGLTAGIRTGLTNAGLNPDDYGMIVTTTGVTIAKGWLQDGIIVTKGDKTLEAGDLIQYNAGVTSYSGAWKVLGAEGGNLLVMSTNDVDTLLIHGLEGNGTTTNYGLLNGIYRLNEICSVYGKGTGAVGARSGKVDYTTKNGQSGTLSTTHSSGFSYVDFNTMTIRTIEVNAIGMPTLTGSNYQYNIAQTMLPTLSQKATEMIQGSSSYPGYYWIASFYNGNFNSEKNEQGLFIIIPTGIIFGAPVYYSDGSTVIGNEAPVRAVVEISPNITIGAKDNTLGWSYTI